MSYDGVNVMLNTTIGRRAQGEKRACGVMTSLELLCASRGARREHSLLAPRRGALFKRAST